MLGDHFPLGIAVDGGEIYVVGHASQVLRGGTEAFLSKYDASGNETWTRHFGTESDDRACAVAIDSSGICVAGQTQPIYPSQPDANAFVRKFDRTGSEVWSRSLGAGRVPKGTGVAVGSDGVHLIYSLEDVPGIRIVNGTPVTAHVTENFMRKYDVNGNELWARQLSHGDGSPHYPYGVAADSGGAYTFGFGLVSRYYNGFVRGYSAIGEEIWTSQFGVTGAYGIAVDSSGVYVTGRGYLTVPKSDSDVILRKYDKSGKELWARQFGGTTEDCGIGITLDSRAVYVVGTVSNPPAVFLAKLNIGRNR